LKHQSAVVLASVVAVTALAGGALSLTQHAAAPPTPRPVTTTPVPATPVTALGYTAVDDPITHTVVLFGGVDNYANTWLWDGTRWQLVHPGASPPGRSGASAAFDPQTAEVLLFGGRLATGDGANDTWAWDGTTWRELTRGSGQPPPGEGSAMAWDGATEEMVLVTAVSEGGAGNWIWRGNRWINQMSSYFPNAAFVSGMAFDPVSRSLLAIGCCQAPTSVGGTVDTTWRLDKGKWQQLVLAPDPPAVGSSLALDPARGRLVLCSCDGVFTSEPVMWLWTGEAWVSLAVAHEPVTPAIEVADVDRDLLLVLGSLTQGSSPIHVWGLSGSSWLRLDRDATSGP
jgi:hypothetical protein